MKIALLLIADPPPAYDAQAYLDACTTLIKEYGQVVISPPNITAYRQVINPEYIKRITPVINEVYTFTDFGLNINLTAILKHLRTKNIKTQYNTIPEEQLKKLTTTLGGIITDLSHKSGIPYEQIIKDKTRKREIVQLRQIYYTRAREMTEFSLATIGSKFTKDHATVLHGIKAVVQVKDLREKYRSYFGKYPPAFLIKKNKPAQTMEIKPQKKTATLLNPNK